MELADVRHALHNSNVEMEILEEKLQKQEQVIASLKKQLDANELSKNSASVTQQASFVKRLELLEKFQEKLAADVRQMNSQASLALAKLQTIEQQVAAHDGRLEEVVKLKSTLTSISKAINPRSSSLETSTSSYKIKQGDSLEKIARAHRISVDAIKRINGLDSDKIIVGQEIRIPSDAN